MMKIYVWKKRIKKCADEGHDQEKHTQSSINVLKIRRTSLKSSKHERKVNRRLEELFDLEIVPQGVRKTISFGQSRGVLANNSNRSI